MEIIGQSKQQMQPESVEILLHAISKLIDEMNSLKKQFDTINSRVTDLENIKMETK